MPDIWNDDPPKPPDQIAGDTAHISDPPPEQSSSDKSSQDGSGSAKE